MRWWKWLGVAGLAGVAATGVVVARNERTRRAYSPDDVRDRLHERAATIEPAPTPAVPEPVDPAPARKRLLSRIFRREHAETG